MTALLEVRDLEGGYGPVKVLHGLSFEVNEGEVVVILGANGAGKTTTLRAISGQLKTSGTIKLDDKSIARKSPEAIVRKGVALVPQGRGTFNDLTVEENLRIGAYTRKNRAEISADIDFWYDSFPRLKERSKQRAGSMSGGEQQMLAIARALMSRPRLLLLDEPSLGLAPLITEDLFRRLHDQNQQHGTTMLIVEQNANLALGIAQRGYVIETGAMVADGTAEELQSDEAVRRAYLGY